MTEILKSAGEQRMIIGEKPIMAKEVLAKAVWQLVTTGEVLLSGRLLAVQSVTEWAQVVKWLYAHAEPATQRAVEEQPEMIVRVVREDLAEHESLPLLVPSIDEGE